MWTTVSTGWLQARHKVAEDVAYCWPGSARAPKPPKINGHRPLARATAQGWGVRPDRSGPILMPEGLLTQGEKLQRAEEATEHLASRLVVKHALAKAVLRLHLEVRTSPVTKVTLRGTANSSIQRSMFMSMPCML